MNDEKEIKNYRERIRLHIKKNKRFYTWLFIFLILPLFVECVIYFIEKGLKIEFIQAFKKIFYILREYKSYYATILTLSFAIFSYNKQQEKLLEERQKENELREKELEDKKDYYRPVFIIEEGFDSKKKIKLLMKNTELFLKNIKVYAENTIIDLTENYIDDHRELKDKQGELYINYGTFEIKNISYKPLVQSGDIITECDYNKFFISAETLIGEIILFGYYSQNVVFYKYLKQNRSASCPILYTKEIDDKKMINEVWGDFNISENNNNNYTPLEKIFFKESYIIRVNLNRNINTLFKGSLEAETYSDFLRYIFEEIFFLYIDANNGNNDIKDDNIYVTIKNFITIIRNICSKLYIDSSDNEKIEKINFDFLADTKKNFENMQLEKTPVNTRGFWDIIEEYLKYPNQKESLKYLSILRLLRSLFYIIKVDPEFNMTFYNVSYSWKKIILRIHL